MKEPQFFSAPAWYRALNYRKYLALFPERSSNEPVSMEWVELLNDKTYATREITYKRNPGRREVTGEASANTMAQVKPNVLYRYFPEVKLIAILREPVARAFSHYRMLQRFSAEGRRLPFTPTNFTDDTAREIEQLLSGGKSYFIKQGIYHMPLKEWIDQFGRKQIKVFITEHLAKRESALAIMAELTQFLEIEKFDFENVMDSKFNVSAESPVPGGAREMLEDFYRSHNEELSKLLERELPW